MTHETMYVCPSCQWSTPSNSWVGQPRVSCPKCMSVVTFQEVHTRSESSPVVSLSDEIMEKLLAEDRQKNGLSLATLFRKAKDNGSIQPIHDYAHQ